MQDKTVEVSNFDEVRLGLRKELDRLRGKLDRSAQNRGGINLALDINGMQELMEMVYKLMDILVAIDYKPTINLPEIELPEIKLPDINIPEIKVPNVYVPEPRVNVTTPPVQIDVKGIINALDSLKYLSDRPDKPISVRMSDGKKFQKAIEQLTKATDNLGVVYSGSSGITTEDMRSLGLAVTNRVGDGSRTVTTAGTRVQLSTSSVPCRKVKLIGLDTNTGTIWVGGSTVADGRGEPIVALQSTDWIETTDLTNIYLDSTVNGEGVSYIYV